MVSGPHARYKGSGTINGEGDYGFLLTANDGAVKVGRGIDTFRIRIWRKDADESVVYGNGSDQELGAGNIVIDGG